MVTKVNRVVAHEAAGDAPADIQAAVDAFRASLGGANNGVGDTFPDGRREINWDGVPDSFSAPNSLPADFFNVNSPRGVVFSTPGSGFQVSADSDNPTSTPVRFGNIDDTFPDTFSTFSPQRLFTALGSNVTEVQFFVPGTTKPATVDGFGAVFTDVDSANGAKIEYFGADDVLLFSKSVPPVANSSASLSFAAATFDMASVARVRITSGAVAPGQPDGDSASDVIVMDDFIYGEPQELKEPANTPPSIEPISPAPDSKIHDRTPTIRAEVTDAETNLTKADIKLYLDGKPKNFAYNRDTDRLSSTQEKELAPGKHWVKIEARDETGLVATESWTFEVVRKK